MAPVPNERPAPRPQEAPYGVAEFPAELGNHRARIRVANRSDAVWVHIPWRLHPRPQCERIMVVDATTGSPVPNVLPVASTRECGNLVFQPETVPGTYYVYYMVWQGPRASADPAWRERNGLTDGNLTERPWESLPQAALLRIEARTEFDRFDPMEVIATAGEVSDLLNRSAGEPYLLFPEDRAHPIRMRRDLPLRWVKAGPETTFRGCASRGEYYTFQIGVYSAPGATSCQLPSSLCFEPLQGPAGSVIPADALCCFNLGGVDPYGHPFKQELRVAPGEVTALWCGVDVPTSASPGLYQGTVWLSAADGTRRSLQLELQIEDELRANSGDDDPGLLSRLKWLDSRIGLSDDITPPYTPLRMEGNSLSCLGRRVLLESTGLPGAITADGMQVLAGPVTLRPRQAGSYRDWQECRLELGATAAHQVGWSASGQCFELSVHVQGTMEFDGRMAFAVRFSASRSTQIEDIVLAVPFVRSVAEYMVGMGQPGGKRPQAWKWRWTSQQDSWRQQGCNLEFFTWLGSVRAGLYCRLAAPLEAWQGAGQGYCEVIEDGPAAVLFQAHTGPISLVEGEPIELRFRLLPTPLKPLDHNRWSMRYAHTFQPVDSIKAAGATVVNIHHATVPNLWINYPFLNLDVLEPYVREAHRAGLKVKLYYTVRELTNRLPELWALRSLGDEIYRLSGVSGHGMPHLDTWLREHLVEGYTPGWIWRVPTGEVDAALRTQFTSRLNNFYLEGVRWLLEHVKVDGLYLDEIGYPREIMQRLRRVLDGTRPGSLIDLHGNRDWWSCNCPVGYYLEHLPYVDRVWFGEAFNPDSPPDFWLVEMSGLPFGLSGDLLENPNPWRGMVYGMTPRAFYSGPTPSAIWQIWDEFGIADASMVGYWEATCPVQSDDPDVLATTYAKDKEALVALASWAPAERRCRLTIDWDALGLKAESATISAPEVAGFQLPATFAPNDEIPVAAGKGWLLLIRPTGG